MAHQWARYRVEIPNGEYNYQPGRTYDIAWNVAESGCGSAPVTIAEPGDRVAVRLHPLPTQPGVAGRLPGGGRRVLRLREPELLPDVPDLFRLHRRRHAAGAPAAVGGGGSAGSIGAVPVVTSGAAVTIPASPYSVWRGKDYAGTVITAPTPGIAAGIAAGFGVPGVAVLLGRRQRRRPHPGHPRRRQGGRRPRRLQPGRVRLLRADHLRRRPLPRRDPQASYDQRSSAPTQVPWDQALPGDLVGYDGHITVYLGVIDGRRMQLESPQSGDYIKISGVRADADSVVHRWWTP